MGSRKSSVVEAVGDCILSRSSISTNNNSSRRSLATTKQTKGAKSSKAHSLPQAIVVVCILQGKQAEEQPRKSDDTLTKKTIEKLTTTYASQQQQRQQQKSLFRRQTAVAEDITSCYAIHFFIVIRVRNNKIGIDVLLLVQHSISNTSEMVVTWPQVHTATRGGARHCRSHNSSKRANRSSLSSSSNNNNTLNMFNMPAINGSTASNNSNNFGSQTGRAIMSVATTLASTSATMAMANIPTTNLLPPPTSTTESIWTASFENNWTLDGVSWPTMNQSSTDKVDLIEMDLANETLSGTYPALRRYHGDYDVSYIARINPFWLQFEPPSTRTYYIMAIIYIIISSVGCLGNSLVIFMFLRCKSLRTPANTLVINLAVSDLLMLMKCPIAIYNNFKQGPALGDAGCRIYGFVGGLSGTASIGTLTAIALDRYNVVVHPLDPLRKTAKVRSAYLITMIWIYSFAFSIVPALDIGLSVYVPEGFLTTCSFDYLDKGLGPRIFMFAFFVAAWCVPFSIICFSYFYILKVVFAANRIQSSKEKNKTEQKLALIVVGIIGLWFLAWTPYSVVAMLGVFGKEKYITPLGSMIPALFCKTAACIDPYFYAATHPRFRMEFRRLWLGRGHLRRTSTTRSSYLTRSSTRRLRVISDVDMRSNRSNENAKKQNNLQALQEVTEENDEDYDFSIQGNFSDAIEQSRF
ncbi:neuropeptide SIFamide receptor-like [Rhagoletis pomonella]|uniref:neuropeptide SIFamide receptor-like n=1 Tax=Rhagoletis pomonella TaxID=28610 RepID=UPI00177C6914|nr:neuropeptide SIFamide receptor-like [Rhagoletis pomonella]